MIENGCEQITIPTISDDIICYDIIARSLLSEFPTPADKDCYNIIARSLLSEPVASEKNESSTSEPEESLQNEMSADLLGDDESIRQKRINAFRRFIGFTLVRQTANTEWAAGIAGGEAVIQLLHTNRWATAAAVAGGVAILENKQSKWALNRIEKSGDELVPSKNITTTSRDLARVLKNKSDKAEPSRFSRAKEIFKASAQLANSAYKEAFVLASASWQGAAATVEINHAHGLKSTPARIKAQSLTFGAAVGLWLTPIPPFKQLNGYAREAFDYILENPFQSFIGGTGVSVGIYGMLKGFKAVKNRISERRIKTSKIDETSNPI